MQKELTDFWHGMARRRGVPPTGLSKDTDVPYPIKLALKIALEENERDLQDFCRSRMK